MCESTKCYKDLASDPKMQNTEINNTQGEQQTKEKQAMKGGETREEHKELRRELFNP